MTPTSAFQQMRLGAHRHLFRESLGCKIHDGEDRRTCNLAMNSRAKLSSSVGWNRVTVDESHSQSSLEVHGLAT
jgi:hypothetical protein